MYKNAKMIFLILISALLFSCSQKSKNEYDVVTTIYPMEMITKEIYPELKIYSLVKVAVSPHDYSPKPSDIIKIQNAELFLKIGGDFDKWASTIIDKNNIKITKINFLENHFKKKSIPTKVKNPHIWLSIEKSKQIAEKIYNKINQKFNKDNKEQKEKLKKFKKNLDKLKNHSIEKFKKIQNKKIMLYHSAWEYILNEIGLNIEGVIKDNPQMKISTKYMRELIDFINDNNIKLIIGEIQHKNSILKTLKNETDVKIVYLNAIGSNKNKNYIDFLSSNIEKIYKAFKN